MCAGQSLSCPRPRRPPARPQVMQLAVAGCKAVADFMRQQLLEHTQALAAARAAGEPDEGGGSEGEAALGEDAY